MKNSKKYQAVACLMGSLVLSSMALADVKVLDTQRFDAKYCEGSKKKEVCSKYEIEFQRFSGSDWLNQYIEKDIRATVSDDASDNTMAWQPFLAHYANVSTEVSGDDVVGEDFWMKAESKGIQGDWTVLEVSTHQYFSGAAHGMPGRSFRVLDTAKEKPVLLQDIVLPGANVMKALEKAQYQAVKQYHIDVGNLDAEAAEGLMDNEHFSYHLSEDWRPVKGGLAFGYGAYEIGPYVIGMPEIFVKKADLQKIIRPGVLQRLDSWPVAYEKPDAQ